MTTDSILLVDTDAPFLRVISQALRAGGYEVETVSGTQEAEALLAARDFAAIMLSLDVSESDPDQFLRAVAADDRQPTVVLVATHIDIQEMARLYDLGPVFCHRRKPVEDVGDIIRDLNRGLELRLARRQSAYLLNQLRDTRDELHDLNDMLVQAEKAAALGWVANGLITDLETALVDTADAAGVSGSGRTMRSIRQADLQEALDQCRALVSDARAAIQGPRGEFRPIELARLVHSTTRLNRTALAMKGVELELGPIDETVVVNGDGPNLRLVLSALIQNAAQASASGGKVTVSLTQYGSSVHLNVRDRGPGMSDEVLSRCFDPFFTTRSMGEGTGLGLSVAKEIVHRHGGEVVLATVKGEGTTAVITLPVVEVAESLESIRSAVEAA